jgi:murein DD-endopeptidase MepM/ murein hydrolase activator NlpD
MEDQRPQVPHLTARFRWGLGLSIVGLIVAAALAMSGRTEPEPSRPQVAASRADIFLAPDTEIIRGLVPRNTTLEALLRMHGLASDSAQRVIEAISSAFDPRRLRASQPFMLVRTLDGDLRRFLYEIDGDRVLRVTHVGEHSVSAFQAMESAGERPELSIALADIFSGEIDFNTELQPGDRFGLAFEKFTREPLPDVVQVGAVSEGERTGASYGDIAAAEFRNDGRVLRAIRFTPPGGKPAYYDEKGRSLRRFFLRSPLRFEPRITSRFSRRRLHPVLGRYRAHLGVDYGAPTGAPVVAVASGTVVSATSDRANGRMVRLKHSGGYETYYLHLSAFGPGIRAGVRVSQGQLIGKVGATGLASGPHLDYRLRKNGSFVDPLTEHRKMPPGEPVPASAMAAFTDTRDRALRQLDEAMKKAAAPPVLAAAH